jgi:hypothetical protein
MRLTKMELALAAGSALLLGVLLRYLAPGGPLSSDVLWYLNVGLTGARDTFILNRYFHVFLEWLFVQASATPLEGVQSYWAFLIAATAFLIYLNARLCTQASAPWHGLLAVGIFFSLSDLAKWAGTPFVDLTAMLLVSLAVTLYLLSIRRQNRAGWILLLLGTLFYLGLRTKETLLIVGLLLPGLGFTSEDRFDPRQFLTRLAYLLAGAAIGALVYSLLCGIVLKDPFFGWRWSEFQEFRASYVQNFDASHYSTDDANWYTGFALEFIYIPFLLYLLSGFSLAASLPKAARLVWLLPLGSLLFLIFTANNIWGFESRHFLPAYAVLATLAPQFVEISLPDEKAARIRTVAILAAAVLLPVAVRFAIRPLVYAASVDFGQFLEIIFHPVLLTVLIGIYFLTKRGTRLVWIAAVICLSGLLVSPLLANARTLFIERPNQALSRFDFYPFAQFASQIEAAPDARFYIDSSISEYVQEANHLQVPMLAADRNEVTSMFNLYFDARLSASQFSLSSPAGDIAADLLTGDYDYAFLTAPHWSAIADQPEVLASIREKYRDYAEPQDLVILLERR